MKYTWGPHPDEDGACFRLWAPAAKQVLLERDGLKPIAMQSIKSGWWDVHCSAPAGTRYRFCIDDKSVPDPASRRQVEDVHGWSIVETDTYAWKTQGWSVPSWETAILYELHPGLFGGFRGIVSHLDRLADIGITAIELMPVNDFPGSRNWGYDGVLPYAPDESYGAPDDLKALVDAAHERGLMIFLDVVYNHFGPDGNYLPLYAPEFFRADWKTPWGDAIDFRKEPVRRFFIENALYWLEEFRFDGLRFDAVHAICDFAFLADMGKEIHSAFPGRHLVLENEDNDTRLLDIYRAQWNDDFHNTLHVLLTEENAGYYGDFADNPAAKLARLLHQGFAFQGEWAEHIGRKRGTPSGHISPTSFVSFLQNHDQTGNRALGERLIHLADERALRAAVALQLLCPQIPLLFMGEESGEKHPFLFFTDHQVPSLVKAVREGRAAEFAKFLEFASGKVKVPDPNAEQTYEQSRLGDANKEWEAYYRHLLLLRHEKIIPHLTGAYCLDAVPVAEKAVIATWRLGDGAKLSIASNLADASVETQLPKSSAFFGQAADGILPPFTTAAWIELP